MPVPRSTKKVTPTKKSRIPSFKTIEEEAEFWDTHSTEEFEDEWEPMDEDIEFVMVRAQPKKPMTIRLEPDVVTLLTREAKSVGVGASTLARMAVLKYLKDCGRGTMILRDTPKRKRSKGAA
jgi:hypothetical protein